MLLRPLLIPFIVLFWCVTTSWLLVAKILPSLAPGSPPGYQALYASQGRPVGWTVLWNDQPLGWALSQAHRRDDGGMDVETALHFDRLPMDDVLPSWTKTMLPHSFDPSTAFTLDARGQLSIDAGGGLRTFRSTIDLPAVADQMVLNGMIDKGIVHMLVSSRDLNYSTSRHLPTNVSLGDELSPQASLPGLFPNRRWTVPVYSPLRPGQAPVEILHAQVVGEEPMFWNDSLRLVDVVHYRDDPSNHHEPRCRLWVDRSGNVLKQESVVLGSRLVFVRRSDEAAERLLSIVDASPADVDAASEGGGAEEGAPSGRGSEAEPS